MATAARQILYFLVGVTFWAILVIGVVGFVVSVSGCETFDSLGSGSATGPKAQPPSDGGTFSRTLDAMWWAGGLAAIMGWGVFILRLTILSGLQTGGAGAVAGVAGPIAMFVSDLLTANQWILWIVIALGLIAALIFGAVEIVGPKRLKQLWRTISESETKQAKGAQ